MILKEFLDKCSRNENVCILIANTQFESFVRQPQGLKEDFKGLLDCEVIRFFSAAKDVWTICVIIECDDLNRIRGVRKWH